MALAVALDFAYDINVVTIGDRVRRLRKRRGWTQEELAYELGVSFVSINRWENGHAKPSRMAQRLIALLFAERVGAPDSRQPR